VEIVGVGTETFLEVGVWRHCMFVYRVEPTVPHAGRIDFVCLPSIL
jgi:hypothetical protein